MGGTADALLELLSQSEQSRISFEWLLDNVLHNDLTGQNNSPFLVGKGLWVAARWAGHLLSLIHKGLWVAAGRCSADLFPLDHWLASCIT